MKYLAITAILCLVLAGASFAGNVTMTEVITGGNLTLTTPGDFSLTTAVLGGQSSIIKGYSSFWTYVEDARGTGEGWNLGVQISQFQTGGTPNRTLPPENFCMYQMPGGITCMWGQAKDGTYGHKSLITDYYTSIQSTETKLITSAADYGRGKYSLDPDFKLTIPASAYAGTYTATFTMTLNAVP